MPEKMETDISSINEDFKLQKQEWVVQRIIWVLMAAALVAGLLGVLGDSESPMNKVTITLPNAIVETEKYLRVEKSFETRITLNRGRNNARVSFNKDYYEKLTISRVIPEAEKVEVTEDQIIYTFNSTNGGSLLFIHDPEKMGSQGLQIEVNGEKGNLSQFIYF
jgi:hypothetical protein